MNVTLTRSLSIRPLYFVLSVFRFASLAFIRTYVTKCASRSKTNVRLFLPMFHRYGRVQSVKILSKHPASTDSPSTNNSSSTTCAGVAFMDITSACKAHSVEHSMDDRVLRTNFYDPNAAARASSSAGDLDDKDKSSSAVNSGGSAGSGGGHSSHAYSSSPSSGGSTSTGPRSSGQDGSYSSSRRSSYRSSFQSSEG